MKGKGTLEKVSFNKSGRYNFFYGEFCLSHDWRQAEEERKGVWVGW